MTSSLLIDANLSVLLVVGFVDESYIARHRRLRAFDVADFRWVSQRASAADQLVLVPSVVTETSNLLRQIGDPIRSELMRFFGRMLLTANECYVPSKEAANRSESTRLGLTDAVLLKLGETGATLLTVDLYLAAQTAGFQVENYNHIRDNRPDFNL